MNLVELDSFKMADAITFHDNLNPKLFNKTNLRTEVKNQLLLIAKDFLEELGVKDLSVKDITVSGSNAAYSYTDHSDLDLHILIDMSDFPDNPVYTELFNTKKTIYNDTHDIKVHGVPVELYVQDSREPVISLGEYSILHDKWLRIPTKRRSNFDQTATKSKYEKLLKLIEVALLSKDIHKVENVLKTIKRYRQAGLDLGGEFGPENLAYKALRSQGYITKLYALRDKLHSKRLSIENMYENPKDDLKKQLSKEFKKYQYTDEDYDPNETPPGPEFKPTMPAGTVKVDVSDVYDWYKLGQHISNLNGLGDHDFGKGPPSTIMAFGSEPEEHKYIKNLEKTGLTTTDIDPYDPKQPEGMKRQKVDPTYNVNEKINPEVTKQDFRAEKDINIEGVGPLKLIAYNLTPDHPPQFRVEVIRPDGKSIAYFRFIVMDYEPEPKYKLFAKFSDKKDPYIIGGNVSVWSEYQKKGIATQVYQWVKSMGNDIKPSDTQTPAGKAMWRGFEKNKTMQGVAEVVNPDVTSDEYYNDPTKNVRMGDFEFNARTFTGALGNQNARGLQIRAYDPTQPKGQNLIGSADFIVKSDKKGNQWLESDDTEVNDEYRGKGVATMMYAFAKSLGNDVKASPYQSQKGREMWKKWGSDSTHLVGEDLTQQYAAEKTLPVTPYGNKERVFRGAMAEAFDQPYKLKWEKGDFGDIDAYTTLPDGTPLSIMFNKEDNGLWFVEFYRNQTQDLSGEGDAQKIFATVLHAINQFIKKVNPKQITFSAVKENDPTGSRSSLYDKLVQRYASNLGYSVERHAAAHKVSYDLIRQRKLEEASGYIPSEKEKNDPRFKTALTVDVKPDSIKKNAKAFSWLTNREGIPPTLRPSGKF